jgi:hypothetical protein
VVAPGWNDDSCGYLLRQGIAGGTTMGNRRSTAGHCLDVDERRAAE